MVRVPALVAALTVLGPVVLMAQRTAEISFPQLRPGQTVRVRTQDGERLEGRISAISPDQGAFTIGAGAAGASFPVTAVDSLWIQRHQVIAGAVVGGVIFAGAGLVFASAFCSTVDCGPAVLPLSPVAGAAVGALAGAALGALIPSWRLRYSRVAAALWLGPGSRQGLVLARLRF